MDDSVDGRYWSVFTDFADIWIVVCNSVDRA